MTGSTDILEKATDACDQAVKCMPEDDPNRALCLNNMGIVFERRFEQTGSPKDFEKAIEMRELAVQIVTAPPYVRIQAAHALSKRTANGIGPSQSLKLQWDCCQMSLHERR